MHRDDLSLRNTLNPVQETRLPLHLEEFTVILVDDVLYTGRTCEQRWMQSALSGVPHGFSSRFSWIEAIGNYRFGRTT